MRRGSKWNRLLDTWLGVPLLNSIATVRRRREYPSRVDRVGVFCSFALGDTLLFSGALRGLRSHFPTQHLVHFCSAQNIAAAELIQVADELVEIDILKPIETIRRIRDQNLDLLLDFSSWQRLTAIYSVMSGARFTAGFRTENQRRHRGYDQIAVHSRDRHEIDNFRALLRSVGIAENFPPAVVLPDVPTPAPLVEERDIIVFHLWPSGVRSYTREWPEDRWVDLATALAGSRGQNDPLFLITGSPSDRPRSEPFAARLREAGLNAEMFVGRDGLASLCQILVRSSLVISVNTGIMHLASILGAPTVSLNGPNTNRRWGPVGRRAFGIESPGEGCGYLHLGFESCGATDCMERITVDMVLGAVDRVAPSRPALAEEHQLAGSLQF